MRLPLLTPIRIGRLNPIVYPVDYTAKTAGNPQVLHTLRQPYKLNPPG